jgi:prevent-host-death family protein
MTSHVYLLVMNTVGIAELKARLSDYLRAVRRGHTLTVLDRDTAVACLIPYVGDASAIQVRSPRAGAPRLQRVPLPPPLRLKVDVVGLLADERQPVW